MFFLLLNIYGKVDQSSKFFDLFVKIEQSWIIYQLVQLTLFHSIILVNEIYQGKAWEHHILTGHEHNPIH